MIEKRMNVILGCISQKKQVTLKELHALYPDYNEMTIRRDLIMLEKNGYIERVRGGARIKDDTLPSHFRHQERNCANIAEKRKIALNALKLIVPSMSIYLDASTTSYELAKILPNICLFVTTNDPLIALELQSRDKIEIILTGGSLNKSVTSVSGPLSMYALDRINIDMAFIGAAGVDAKCGFSNALHNECELKRKVISNAKKTVLLVDSSKFDKALPYSFATFSAINMMISDRAPSAPILAALEANGVKAIY